MTTPGSMGAKIRQLDNDVHEIYDMLTDMSGMLQLISKDVADHTVRLDSLESKLVEHDARFEGIDAKLDQVLELLQP